jgi:D-proline reductase (dithiol) PrdB
MRQDPNLAFPIDRLNEVEQAGRIGSVSDRHLSFMGSITAPGRLVRETAPEAARWLVEDGVDAALLVPV